MFPCSPRTIGSSGAHNPGSHHGSVAGTQRIRAIHTCRGGGAEAPSLPFTAVRLTPQPVKSVTRGLTRASLVRRQEALDETRFGMLRRRFPR
jgi:hypothetical protein